jgi:hypothetical protein
VKTIKLKFCELDWIEGFGAKTRFPDGTQYGAHPHDSPHYWNVAYRCGYEGDVFAYCREHELAHHLIAENFNSHSPIIWALAHGDKPPPMIVPAEEALALALQRYARSNEPPFIDGIDWRPLKARFLELAEG